MIPEGITIPALLQVGAAPGAVVLIVSWLFRAEIKVWLKGRAATAREMAQMTKRLDDHVGKEEQYWARMEARVSRLEDNHQAVEGRLITMTAALEGQNQTMQAQMAAQSEKIAWLAESVDKQATALHDLTQALMDYMVKQASRNG